MQKFLVRVRVGVPPKFALKLSSGTFAHKLRRIRGREKLASEQNERILSRKVDKRFTRGIGTRVNSFQKSINSPKKWLVREAFR